MSHTAEARLCFFFFFYLGQKHSVLSRLPSSIELVLLMNIFHYKAVLRNNRSRLRGWQQACPISGAQFCCIVPGFSLPPCIPFCESSSLTPISLLQHLLCFGSCFSLPPLLNLSFHPVLQKFFQFLLGLLPHLLLPSWPSATSQPLCPHRLRPPKMAQV